MEDTLSIRLEKLCIRAQIHGIEADAHNFLCLGSHSVYNLIDGQEPGMRSAAVGRDSVWGSDRLDRASLLTQCLLILIVKTRNDVDFGRTGFQYELCIRCNCWTLGQGNLPQSTSFLICIIRLMAPPDGRKVKIKRSNAQETPMLIPGIR